MENDLVAGLLSVAALTDLVGRRLDWVTRPQGEGYPSVELLLAGGARTYTMAKRVGLVGYRVQVDVWAETHAEAVTVKEALIAATDAAWATADPFQAVFVEDEHDAGEPGDAPQPDGATDLYRKSFDLRVFHRSTT